MTTPQPDVQPTEVAALLDEGALLLDVREDDEWEAGHAAQAIHVPLGDVAFALADGRLPRDRRVLALCRSGARSAHAAAQLAAAGLDVHNVAGGMQAWAGAGLAVQRTDGTPGQVA